MAISPLDAVQLDDKGISSNSLYRQEKRFSQAHSAEERAALAYENLSLQEKTRRTTVELLNTIADLITVPESAFGNIQGTERLIRRAEMQHTYLEAIFMKASERAFLLTVKESNGVSPETELRIRRMVARDMQSRVAPFTEQFEHPANDTTYWNKEGRSRPISNEELKQLPNEEQVLFRKLRGEVSLYIAERIEKAISPEKYDEYMGALATKIAYYEDTDGQFKPRTIAILGIGGYAASGKEGLISRGIDAAVLSTEPIPTGTAGIAGHTAPDYQEWSGIMGLFDDIKETGRLLPDRITMLAVAQQINRHWHKICNKDVPSLFEGFPRGEKQPHLSIFGYFVKIFGPEKVKYFYMTLSKEMQAVRYFFRIIDGEVGRFLEWKDDQGKPIEPRSDDMGQLIYKQGTVPTEQIVSDVIVPQIIPAFLLFTGKTKEQLQGMSKKEVKKLLLEFQLREVKERALDNVQRGYLNMRTEDSETVKARRNIDVKTREQIESALRNELHVDVYTIECDNMGPKEMDSAMRQYLQGT